jgi:antitoxin (DNA-binding transcriptional repressor) of toxin-antitoxin stability system
MASFKAVRAIPIARLIAIAELMMLIREHVMRLEPHERRRVIELVRRGRGRPSRLNPRERRELARLVAKAEPRLFATTAAKKLVPFRPTKLRR